MLRELFTRSFSSRLRHARLCLATIACAMAALTAASVDAQGSGSSRSKSQVGVGAQVAAFLRIDELSRPAAVQLQEGDIARGFVDIDGASSLRVQSNTGSAFFLAVVFDNTFVSRVVVRMLGTEVVADASGAAAPIGNAYVGKRLVAVSYRIYLSPNARAGTYAWPVGLSFSSLA